jgi:nicotinamidase-related amidase
MLYQFRASPKRLLSANEHRPAKHALLVLDMQNGTVQRAFNSAIVVGNVRRILEAARGARLPVIYSQSTGFPSQFLSLYNHYEQRKRGIDAMKAGRQPGSSSWGIASELAPTRDDFVLKKYSPAGLFEGTPLDMILRNRGVDGLLFTGIATEGVVETTIRDAAGKGYVPTVVEDGVTGLMPELHEHALALMRERYDFLPTKSLVQLIQNGDVK